jgi:hypothetical protein
MSAAQGDARRVHPRRFIAKLVRLLLIVAGGIFLIWMSISVSVANRYSSVAPVMALSFAPYDARAKAELAQAKIVELASRPGDPTEIERLLREALMRDPTNAAAWRSLALASQFRRDALKTGRLFHFAERLSRRDLATQLWLIEERVSANDIRGALQHYDIALRTSSDASGILMPILVSATSNDGIVGPLADLMATDPPWEGDLLARLAEGAPSSDNLATFMERLARSRPLPQSPMIPAMINRLIESRDFQAAWRIQRVVRPPSPVERFIRNGQFDILDPVSAFDWRFANEDDLGAEPIILSGAGQGASLQLHAARAGIVARQLLLLPPGEYRVTAAVGPIAGSARALLHWSFTCAVSPEGPTVEGQPLLIQARATLQLRFNVPDSGCSAQWLSLEIRPETDTAAASAWIDAVDIRPLASGSQTS